MAVDSRDKRASILGLGLAALLVLPAPGALDQPDRQQLAYTYRGLSGVINTDAIDSILVIVGADDWTVRVPVDELTVAVSADDWTVRVPRDRGVS